MPDISSMSYDDIITYLKDNSAPLHTVKKVRSMSIDAFYDTKGITIRCPFCLSTHHVKNGSDRDGSVRHKCKDCGKTFKASTNTIFDGTPYSVNEMLSILRLAINFTDYSLAEAELEHLGISIGSVWNIFHKIWYILNQMPKHKLSGVIQMDEKFFREDQKGSHDLRSYLNPSESRKARRHVFRSECGIFGPEFVTVLCAVDNRGYYWARCVCLGPMGIEELEKAKADFLNISYICSDAYKVYSDWCKKHGYKHYVEPSNYRKLRQARGYVNTDDVYRSLTQADYNKNEKINQQLYKEGLYPHIENTDHLLDFHELYAIINKFGLGINKVNGFHSAIDDQFIHNTRGVGSEYLHDYIGAFVWLHNYKLDHDIKEFRNKDVEDILARMIDFTVKRQHSPTEKDVKENVVSKYTRPSKRAITDARTRMKAARKIIIEPKEDEANLNEFEGDHPQMHYNKEKFFRSIGTTRLNELAKLYGVYNRNERKIDRIRKMSNLPEADEIIFTEIFLNQFGSVAQMEEALERRPQKPQKKRGRPKGSKNKPKP